MALTFMALLYLMEFLVIALMLYAARESLLEKIYGIRFKRWQEIDTGRRGYVILDKGLKSCTINGMKRTVSRENISHGVMYFVSDVVENLKVEDAKDKYRFYMNTEEFDTVYKNKILQTLMLSMQTNYLLILLILIAISIVIGIYNAYTLYQMKPSLDYVVIRVGELSAR